LHNYIVADLVERIPQPIVEEALSPAFGAYDRGDYTRAFNLLSAVVAGFPRGEEVLFPYLEVCNRVLSTPVHPDDITAARQHDEWLTEVVRRQRIPDAIKRFLPASNPPGLRCKYCGRFTNRSHCGRSYPFPSYEWDSVAGQTYMFYRRSVPEKEFYRDFFARFDVRETNDNEFGAPLGNLDGDGNI
jgi:hypothetical protein